MGGSIVGGALASATIESPLFQSVSDELTRLILTFWMTFCRLPLLEARQADK